MKQTADKFRAVGLGEFLWDLLPAGKQLGGAPCNFAYHANCLGAESAVVTAIGDDDLGREALKVLEKSGVGRDYITIDPKHPTGTVSIRLDPKGVPEYTIHENVAWDSIPFSAHLKDLAERTDAVCFGSLAQRSPISQTTIRMFLQHTSSDCLKIFDVNLRQEYYSEKCIRESLTNANILKLNEGELPVIARLLSLSGTEPELLASLLKMFDLKVIALTLGEKGSRLVTANESSFAEAPHVEIVDTVGAGDSFTAALTMGILQKLPLKTIHDRANRLAAYVCTQQGAMPDMSAFKMTP